MSITASPLPLKLWKPNKSCSQWLNLYAFCVLLEVVGSGLGGCNTQSALCFAAIKPGFETVQGDMFFICGKQGFDVFKLQAGSLNAADLEVGLNVG